MQADVFFCLGTHVETIWNDSDDISRFILEDNSTLSDLFDEDLEKAVTIIDYEDEYNDNYVEDDHAYKACLMFPDVRPSDPTFQPISQEGLLTA